MAAFTPPKSAPLTFHSLNLSAAQINLNLLAAWNRLRHTVKLRVSAHLRQMFKAKPTGRFHAPFQGLACICKPLYRNIFSSRFLRFICIVQRAVALRAFFLAGFAFATMRFIKRLD